MPLSAAWADVAVIGNASTEISSLTEQKIKDLYLAKNTHLPSGATAQIANLPLEDPTHDAFERVFLKQSPAQTRSHWAKLVFTGKALLPKVQANNEAMKKWVAAAPNRIGYIDGSTIDDSIKVLNRKP